MSVTVRLDRSVYDREAIEIAGRAFAELGSCVIREDAGALEVDLEPLENDDEVDFARHFVNYALAASLAARVEDGS